MREAPKELFYFHHTYEGDIYGLRYDVVDSCKSGFIYKTTGNLNFMSWEEYDRGRLHPTREQALDAAIAHVQRDLQNTRNLAKKRMDLLKKYEDKKKEL